ncbi:MAG: (d)CMP kinase [Candidatus Omnitrophica bacterium]|nr:(d)CMP kinase [Candidatus Omnitrophota bacterium]
MKPLSRAISITVLITFLFTNIPYASSAPNSLFKNKKIDYQKLSDQNQDIVQKKKDILSGEDSKQTQSQQKQAQKILSSHLSDISQIHIPSEIGRIVEVHQGTGAPEHQDKLIVHIQDLHTNPEAEYNLAKILEVLLNDYKMGLVCSEGADGVVDTSSVSTFPDSQVREKISKIFVNAGELTGEEYLSITKYPDLPIWGIESKDIYFRNIIDFNKIMKFNPGSQIFISQAKKALEELKARIYTKELIELDQKEADYKAQKIESPEYVKYLLDSAASQPRSKNILSNYKNIGLLTETIDAEKKIDQLKIMNESQKLLLNLQSSLNAKSLNSDMDSLMAKSSLFKDQKISPFSFYSYLKDLANKHLKDEFGAKYPNLNGFVDYLTKLNSLDSTKLFIELEDLNFEIKQALSRTDEQKTLIKALRNISFLEGFFNLKVSNEELDYYLNNKDFHKVAFFESFLKPAIKKYNISTFIDYNPDLIDSHLTELEDFYKVVKDRDIAMVNNSISEIEKRNSKVSALIAGGFHTKGITKLLKEKGYSYIVISPYSKTGINEENYHYLLSGQRKPLMELAEKLNAAALRVILGFVKDPTFETELKKTLAAAGIIDNQLYSGAKPRMLSLFALGAAKTLYLRDKANFDLSALPAYFTSSFYTELNKLGLDVEIRESKSGIHVKCGDNYFGINKEDGGIIKSNASIFTSVSDKNRVMLAKISEEETLKIPGPRISEGITQAVAEKWKARADMVPDSQIKVMRIKDLEIETVLITADSGDMPEGILAWRLRDSKNRLVIITEREVKLGDSFSEELLFHEQFEENLKQELNYITDRDPERLRHTRHAIASAVESILFSEGGTRLTPFHEYAIGHRMSLLHLKRLVDEYQELGFYYNMIADFFTRKGIEYQDKGITIEALQAYERKFIARIKEEIRHRTTESRARAGARRKGKAAEVPKMYLVGKVVVPQDDARTQQVIEQARGQERLVRIDVSKQERITPQGRFADILRDAISYYERRGASDEVADLQQTEFYLVRPQEDDPNRTLPGFIWYDSDGHYLIAKAMEPRQAYFGYEAIDILREKNPRIDFIANMLLQVARYAKDPYGKWDPSILNHILAESGNYLLEDARLIKEVRFIINRLFKEETSPEENDRLQGLLIDIKQRKPVLFYVGLANLGRTYLQGISPNRYPCVTAANLCLARNYAFMDQHLQKDAYVSEIDRTITVFRDVFNPTLTRAIPWMLQVLKEQQNPANPNLVKGEILIKKGDNFLDLTCGTGIFGLFAALNGAESVLSSDINPSAVACANFNAKKLGVAKKMQAIQSDLFNGIPKDRKFNIISFTPPFLDEPQSPGVWLEKAVYDPGFSLLTRFLNRVGNYLTDDGKILFIGTDKSQGPEGKNSTGLMLDLARRKGFISTIIRSQEFHGETYSVYELTRRSALVSDSEIDNLVATSLSSDKESANFAIRELIEQARSAFDSNPEFYQRLFLHLVQIYIEESYNGYVSERVIAKRNAGERPDFYEEQKAATYNASAARTINWFIKDYCRDVLKLDPEGQIVEDYFSCLHMLPIMNRDMKRRFSERDGIEIDSTMIVNGNPEEVQMTKDFYRARLGRIYDSLKVIGIRDDLWLGNIVGMMPLFEDYLAQPSRDQEAKGNKKVILHVLAVNGGAGARNILLTASSDGKGEIILDNGRTMMEQGIEQVKGMVQGLVERNIYGEFFIVIPCDNMILPAMYTADAYRSDRGFYLYARKTEVLRASLNELKHWGPPFGQMFAKRETGIVKGFEEKPNIWKLLNRVMINAIEESNEETCGKSISEFLYNLDTRRNRYLDDLKQKSGDYALYLIALPMIVQEEVWNYVYENGEVEPEIRKIIPTFDEWKRLYSEANKHKSRVEGLINKVLDEGGTVSFTNTFYFLLSRPVAEKIYTLFSQPTEREDSGSFWARKLPKGQTPKMVAALDWAGLILTPMTVTQETWMEDYEKRGAMYLAEQQVTDFISQASSLKEAYCQKFSIASEAYEGQVNAYQEKAAKEGIVETAFPVQDTYQKTLKAFLEKALKKDLINAFAADIRSAMIQDSTVRANVLESAEKVTTYTHYDWNRIWEMALDIDLAAGGLTCVNFGPIWSDVGTIKEAKRLADYEVSKDNLLERALYRGLFELPITHDKIYNVDSNKGKIVYSSPNEFLRYRSVIDVPEGVTLIIGNRVRIANSFIQIIAKKGETVIIPDDTAIVASYLRCSIGKEGKPGSFVYRHEQRRGTLEFSGDFITTIRTIEGPVRGTHPIDATTIAWNDVPVAGTYTPRMLTRPFPGMPGPLRDKPKVTSVVVREKTYSFYRSRLDRIITTIWERAQSQEVRFIPEKAIGKIIDMVQNDRAKSEGRGYISSFLFIGGNVGGLEPQVYTQTLERLSKHYLYYTTPERRIGEEGVFGRRGMSGLQHSLRSMQLNDKYTTEFLNRAKDLIKERNMRGLKAWIEEAKQIDPEEAGIKTLRCALDYLSKEGSQVVLYRIVSRAEIIKEYIRGEHGEELDIADAERKARDLLSGKDPYKVDEQDFLRLIVRGETDPNDAHSGSLSHDLLRHYEEGGILKGALVENVAKYNIPKKALISIMCVFRCPSRSELFSDLAQLPQEDIGLLESKLEDAMFTHDEMLSRKVKELLHKHGKPITVTIDGLAMTGKSTMSKDISNVLGFTRIPGGEISRLITAGLLGTGINRNTIESTEPDTIVAAVQQTLEDVKYKLIGGAVTLCYKDTDLLNNQDLLSQLRSQDINDNISSLVMNSNIVRNLLIMHIMELIKQVHDLGFSVVIDGRLAGTEIERQADVKICLDTSYEAMARADARRIIDQKGSMTAYIERTGNTMAEYRQIIRSGGLPGVERAIMQTYYQPAEERDASDVLDVAEYLSSREQDDEITVISSRGVEDRLSIKDVRETIFAEIIKKISNAEDAVTVLNLREGTQPGVPSDAGVYLETAVQGLRTTGQGL